MDCGTQDALCELTNWLSENELIGPWLVEVIGRFGARAEGVAGALAQFVRDYGQSIVGLIGVSFGFWRWWRYREHILHKRLAEYLCENDARLATGTADLIELIQRPAPGQQFKDPLFIDDDLRVVLRERNWDKSAFALSVETSSDWQLSKAIESIQRRLSTAVALTASLHRQLTSAHAIRGAVAASRADRSGNSDAHGRALTFFQSALRVPGNERNLVVKELEAHQMRKLGLPADEAYAALIELASTMEDERVRNFQTGRLKRYLAEAVQSSDPRYAYQLLAADDEKMKQYPGALLLKLRCEPLDPWQRLEKADAHYLAAYCAKRSGYPVAEPNQLTEAGTEYGRIRISLVGKSRLTPGKFLRLRSRVRAGAKRVAAARNGIYELSWLPAD
jgi:hypothetical protein